MHMNPHAAVMILNNFDKLKGQSIMVRNGKSKTTSMYGIKKGMEFGIVGLQ